MAKANSKSSRLAESPADDSSVQPGASDGNGDVAVDNDSVQSTVTERGWDHWPTPATPEYLIPRMGKVPVSSTVHFQTVAMTGMDEFSPPAVWLKLQDTIKHFVWRQRELGLVQPKEETETKDGKQPPPPPVPPGGWLLTADACYRRFFEPPPASIAELADRMTAAGVRPTDVQDGLEADSRLEEALDELLGIQVEPLLNPLDQKPDAQDTPIEGVILYQEQGWFARGLALGNLLHSVALAPGEVTQIAMTHWNHSTRASDSETTSQQDSTDESDMQDRAVSEIQQAASQEHTSGGSTAASASASESAGFSGFCVDASFGASQSVSAVSSFSDGSKNLSMQSNQKVAALTQRHAEAARTRRATVVREVAQSEDQNLTTRVLANYNHMHALTVMYFEVIEVYDLKTRVVDADRVLFLPFRVLEVWELIPRFRSVLVDAANAIGKRAMAEAIRYCDDAEILRAITSLHTDEKGNLRDENNNLVNPPGEHQRQRLVARINAMQTAKADAQKQIDDIDANIEKLVNPANETLKTLKGVIDGLTTQRLNVVAGVSTGLPPDDPFGIGRAIINNLRQQFLQELAAIDNQIRVAQGNLEQFLAAQQERRQRMLDDRARAQQEIQLNSRELEFYAEVQRLVRMLESPDESTRSRGPFGNNRLYFNQAVWLKLSPSEVLALARRRHKGELLSMSIDPAPVAVSGNYVGYRWRFKDATKAQEFRKQYVKPFIGDPEGELASVKSTIAVPTGGVFGEAVLGEAVSAEKIDLSRFWNWKDSMIPILPTSINPLSSASPTMQALDATPTALDPSSAKLGALQDLPAPSGFGALAETMRAQMFRDMRGQDMLTKLAEATTKSAADGSREAGDRAQKNFMRAADLVEKFGPKILAAVTAPETGGLSLASMSGLAEGAGGITKLGGMLNAKGAGNGASLLKKVSDALNDDKGDKPAASGTGKPTAADSSNAETEPKSPT